MVVKDANYWKEYNQKRKDYLAQKARERRAEEKGERIQPNKNIDRIQLCENNLRIQPQGIKPYTTSDRIQPLKVVNNSEKKFVVDQKEKNAYTTEHLSNVRQSSETLSEKGKDKNLQWSKWSFELFLEQFGYTDPNNSRGVYFSPKQIEVQKSLYREYEAKITVKNNPPIHLPSTNQNQVKTTINTLYE